MSLVSIIIPVFRGHPYLREAITSALAQTWPHIEVIVVDDGSDDEGATRDIVRRFEGRVRYIEKENGGVSSTLNVGIAEMQGEYFSWLSHDDRYHPRKIEQQIALLQERSEAAVVFSDYDLMNENGEFKQRIFAARDFDPNRPIWAILEGRINGCTLLIPRECFDTCGTFDTGLPTTQDYALWFRMVQKYPFLAVPEALVSHRVHAGQGSRTKRHLEEASLLWASMLDEITIADMESAAGSELSFLIRLARKQRRSPFAGARAMVEKRLFTRLAKEHVALVWAEQGTGQGIEEAIAKIEQAGPTVCELIVLDLTKTADISLRIRTRRTSRPTTVIRIDQSSLAQLFQAAADLIKAPLVIFGSSHASLSPPSLQSGLEQILMDEIDAWLADNTPGQLTWCGLPPALQGAIVQRRFLANLVGPGGMVRWPSGLEPSARLGLAQPAKSRPAPNLPANPASAEALHRSSGSTRVSVDALGSRPRPAAANATTDSILDKLSRPRTPGRATLLIVVHAIGGGTIRYAENVAAIAGRFFDILFAWGFKNKELLLSSVSPEMPEVSLSLPSGRDLAVSVMRRRQVVRADVIHFAGLDHHIESLLGALGIPFDITLADYYTIARSPHLTDEHGVYVGEEVISNPGHPIRRTPSPLLSKAERRIAISRDTAARFQKVLPELVFIAARIPEPFDPSGFAIQQPPMKAGEPLRVLLLGQFAPHKGSRTVLEVARKAWEQSVPVSFHVLGTVKEVPEAALQRNISLYGPYEEGKLNELICLIRPHIAWLPFAVPETHSFTISDLMLQGLPILTVGLGAVAERLAGREKTWVLDPSEARPDAYLAWMIRLIRDRLQVPSTCPSTSHLPPLAERFYEKEYIAGR